MTSVPSVGIQGWSLSVEIQGYLHSEHNLDLETSLTLSHKLEVNSTDELKVLREPSSVISIVRLFHLLLIMNACEHINRKRVF